MGVLILSFKFGVSFGSALNFCCGYQCIYRFMVVAVEGFCVGSTLYYFIKNSNKT